MGTSTTGSTTSSKAPKLLAPLAILTLLAAACGGGGGGAADDATDGTDSRSGTTEQRDEGEPEPGGTISVALEAETANWNPSIGNWTAAAYNVGFAIYDPLMARSATGEVEPYLAESLEPNDELTEWTLTLRPDVTFHDGTPFNAEAVRYNLQLAQEPGSLLAGLVDQVEAFEVTGELTGVYRLVETNAAFPDVLTQTPGIMISPTAHQADPVGYGDDPVGTGPFEFVSWNRDDSLVVQRNEDYWIDGLPYLDEIVFRPLPDEETRYQSLVSGGIDAMQSLRQSIVQQALDADDAGQLEANVYSGNNTGAAIFNVLQPPVDDVRVRRGMAYALDQELLIEVLGGEGISPPMTQYHSPDSPWFSEDVAEAWPTNDPDQARELLEEYVDDPERSDGKSPGEPIQIDFDCPPDVTLIELAQAYQSMWEGAGPLEVSLNQVEQQAHIQNAMGSPENDFTGDFMVNCWRVGAQTDPYVTLSVAFTEPATTATNFTNYSSPTIDDALDTLRTSTDFDERFAAVEAIGLDLAENVPNTFTGATATMIATVPEVNNVTGWTLPDGDAGEGIPEAIARWAHVWKDQ